MNANDVKPDRKNDCWDCVGNHFAEDCTKPATKDGDSKGKKKLM